MHSTTFFDLCSRVQSSFIFPPQKYSKIRQLMKVIFSFDIFFVDRVMRISIVFYRTDSIDNPDLLDMDGVIDGIFSRGQRVFIANNDKLCPCTTLDPLPRSTCQLARQKSVMTFKTENVRSDFHQS